MIATDPICLSVSLSLCLCFWLSGSLALSLALSLSLALWLQSPVLCQDSIGGVWLVTHEVLVHPDAGVLLLELIELRLPDPKDAPVVPVRGSMQKKVCVYTLSCPI